MEQFFIRRDERDAQRALDGINNARPDGEENSQESLDEREPFHRAEQDRVRNLRQTILQENPPNHEDEEGEDEHEEMQITP